MLVRNFGNFEKIEHELISRKTKRPPKELLSITSILRIQNFLMPIYLLTMAYSVYYFLLYTSDMFDAISALDKIAVTLIHYMYLLFNQTMFIMIFKPSLIYNAINNFRSQIGNVLAWLMFSMTFLLAFDFLLITILQNDANFPFMLSAGLGATSLLLQFRRNKNIKNAKTNIN